MEPKRTKNVSTSGMEPGSVTTSEDASFEADIATNHAPRKMTFTENVILTIKVLAVAGFIMASLWGVNQWTSPK